MSGNKQKIEIRDNRGHQRYFVDDKFYDVYARLTAPHGLPVYNALCRRANKSQKSWPGIELMMEELGIGKKSVLAGLEILKYYKIIRKDRIGKRANNRYTLLAQKSWRKDWEVMFLEVTSSTKGEVPLRYFTGSSQKLHKFLRGTSNSKVTHKGCTKKDNAEASSAPVSDDEKENQTCQTEGCDDVVSNHDATHCQDHTQRNVDQFVAWCAKSNLPHIRLIGVWADTVRDQLTQNTRGQWMHYINRNARTAKRLSVYSLEQLGNAYKRVDILRETMAKNGKQFDPSLETLERQLVR